MHLLAQVEYPGYGSRAEGGSEQSQIARDLGSARAQFLILTGKCHGFISQCRVMLPACGCCGDECGAFLRCSQC